MNTQKTNDKQVKRATPVRHQPGIAVQTNVKAGAHIDLKCVSDCMKKGGDASQCVSGCRTN